MSDTPRTDAAIESDRRNFEMSREFGDPHYEESGLSDFARQLERELARSKFRIQQLEMDIHNMRGVLNGTKNRTQNRY